MKIQYWFRGSVPIARFVRFLAEGECGCVYDDDDRYFIDGSRVYKKI